MNIRRLNNLIACERKIANRNLWAATEVVSEIYAETERLSKYPINISVIAGTDGSGVELFWDHKRDHHLVFCPRSPKHIVPFLLASALLRLQSEEAAYAIGKAKIPFVSDRQKRGLRSLLDPLASRLAPITEHEADEIVLYPLQRLLASAPFMLADTRLNKRFPVLRSAQFAELLNGVLEDWQARENRPTMPQRPLLLERALIALEGLNALYLDWLFDDVTQCASWYCNEDAFALSKILWQHWQSRYPALQPGDELEVLDVFADILGLHGWFDWVHVPSENPPNASNSKG